MPSRVIYAAGLLVFCCSITTWSGDTLRTPAAEATIELDTEDSSVTSAEPQTDSTAQPDVMPAITTFVNADYPPSLIRKGIAGTVLLELLVNESGTVDSVSVVKGLVPELDSSAVAAARQFRFSPARVDSTPVAVYLQYAYTFSLDNAVDSLPMLCNFSGKCIERGTRRPIPDAMIAVSFPDSTSDTNLILPFSLYLKKIGGTEKQQFDNGTMVTSSDDSGFFRFYDLPKGAIDVKVIIPGFHSFSTHENITPGEETSVRYYIERNDYSEYEVVVYGKIEEKEVSRRQLSVNEVRKIPGFGGDAIKAIQAFPGVARQSAGSGEVIVRGAPSWDSRYFLDGMEIPLLYHFGELKSTYNSDGLSALDFYPGGFGVRYGGAVAGIVELKGRKGTNERIKGSVEASTLDGSVFVEGPITDSITFIVNARRSFIGEVIDQLFKTMPEYFPFTFYPYYWDYTARLDIATHDKGSFYVSLFGSQDSMVFIFPEMRFGTEELSKQTDRMGMKTAFHSGVVGWNYTLSRTVDNSLKYNLMRIDAGFTSPFSKNDNSMLVNHIRDQLTFTLSDNLRLQTGADLQWTNVDVDVAFPVQDNSILHLKKKDWIFSDLAGYLYLEWKPCEKLQLVPGIRYDYFSELQYNGALLPEFWKYTSFNNERGPSGEPSVRLNGRYALRDHHTLKFAAGTYSQSPEPMGEVILPGWGDPKMPATKAAQYVAGYEWQMTDLLDLDAQAYFNRQWNIPVISGSAEAFSSGSSIFDHSGLGRMYGLELMVRHQQGNRFFGWATYTLSRSERYNGSTKKWTAYSEDETHYLQLLGSWKLPRHWETGFHLKFASGKPATIYHGIKEENENLSGTQSFTPKTGKPNSERMEPAFQIDLRVDKKFIHKNYIYSFFLDLQNIGWFLYKTPDMYLYDDFYDDRKPFSMFPLIAIGLRYEF